MNDETKKELIREVTKAVEDKIESKVNAKIEDLQKSFDEHEEQMKPVIEGFRAIKHGRSIIVWIASTVAAVGGAYLVIKQILTFDGMK